MLLIDHRRRRNIRERAQNFCVLLVVHVYIFCVFIALTGIRSFIIFFFHFYFLLPSLHAYALHIILVFEEEQWDWKNIPKIAMIKVTVSFRIAIESNSCSKYNENGGFLRDYFIYRFVSVCFYAKLISTL